MTQGKRIGYIRVSTEEQNPDRQLQGAEVDKKFIDYASGKNIKRPQLEAMLDYVREDDVIIVHSMDRLARNLKDLRIMIDNLVERNVKVQFIKENLTFTGRDSPMSNLLLNIMGAVAEFESAIIHERLMEGIILARQAGKYRGRKKCMNNEKIEQMKQLMMTRKTKTQIAKELGISRASFYKYVEKEPMDGN